MIVKFSIPTELWAGLIIAVIGIVLGWYFTRPAPMASFDCERFEGPAPLVIKCTNESRNEKEFEWDFGDNRTDKDTRDIQHEYKKPGAYKLSLKVYGNGTDIKERGITVLSQEQLSNPISINIVIKTKSNKITELIEEPINYIKDDHSSFLSESSRAYSHPYKIKGNYKIVDVMFNSLSAARAQVNKPTVDSSGKLATLNFRLSSGPQVDRYRGWLKGSLVLKVERNEPSKSLVIAKNLSIDSFSTIALPISVDIASIKSIEIYNAETNQLIAQGGFDENLIPSGKDYSFRIINKNGKAFLEVGRIGSGA
mgnify:CR=1 FL=1